MSDPIDVRASDTVRDVPDDPDAFLDSLTRPTVFHLAGRDRSRRRVVGASLHGNEPSGMRAIHRYLVSGEVPAVDALLFFGAVEAARLEPRWSHRYVPERRDLNRCFRAPFDGPDGRIAARALELFRAVSPELVVDLHNNTGRNPAYVVAGGLGEELLKLSSLFSDRLVWSRLDLGTFSEAFAELCPSITVECGQAGAPQADATAYAGLVRLLRLDQLEPLVVGTEHLMVLEEPARVCLRDGLTLAFGSGPDVTASLTLDLSIDQHNFEAVAGGTRLGWVTPGIAWPVEAYDAKGNEISHELLDVVDGVLLARRAFVPFMLTTHVEIARTDCLFYAATRRT